MKCWECGKILTKLTGNVSLLVGRLVDGKFIQLGKAINVCIPTKEEILAGVACSSVVRVRNERHKYTVLVGESDGQH